MTDHQTLVAVPLDAWPLRPHLEERVTSLQEYALRIKGCQRITFGEWTLVDHDSYIDEDGVPIPPYQLYERIATGSTEEWQYGTDTFQIDRDVPLRGYWLKRIKPLTPDSDEIFILDMELAGLITLLQEIATRREVHSSHCLGTAAGIREHD